MLPAGRAASLRPALGSNELTARLPGIGVASIAARRPAAASFVIAFAAMLLVSLTHGPKPFHYDSGVYWTLGATFAPDGSFSLLNFDSPLRGYLLPLVFDGLASIADGLGWNASTIVKLFNSAVFAAIATVLAPKLAELAWPERRWGIGRRLALAALLIVFWRGYLDFPLSDFPALAAVLLALIAVARSDSPGWMLLAGISASAAVNMRPSYLLLLPVLAVLVGFAWWEHRAEAATVRRALCAVALVAGFALIALPQSLATHRHHDSWSFVPGSAAGLSSLQYTEGLRMQRYDTYVGTGNSPRMVFVDATGSRLLDQRQGGTVESAREYAELVLTHPATMLALFGRHVVNGLDQRYPTPYVETLDEGENRWLRLAGFVLVFLALARVAWPAARRRLGPAQWRWPVALLVCGATSIASAVETRFMLPAALLAYILVLAGSWPNPLAARDGAGVRRFAAPAALLGAFVVFMVVVLSVVGSATEHLQFG